MCWPSAHQSPSPDWAGVGSEFQSRISAGAGVLEIVRLVHWTISRLYMVQPGVQRTKSHKGSRSEFRGPCPDRTVGHETRQSFRSSEVWSSEVRSLEVRSLELQSSELWISEFHNMEIHKGNEHRESSNESKFGDPESGASEFWESGARSF